MSAEQNQQNPLREGAVNSQEPAQVQQTAPRTYNPFIDVVNEKPYTQMSVNVGQNQMAGAIPEPRFAPNTISANENPYRMLNDDFGASLGDAQRQSQPINPTVNNMPEADLKMGAEHLAKMIVDGYEQLHVFANKSLQIPEKKLRKLQADGEIDLTVHIPYDYGKTIAAGDFIKEFNEQNKDTLTVTKEFKKEVTPVLTRVLQKRGAVLTDEQMLLYLFGKDIAVKGVIFTQIKSTANDAINVIKDYTQALRENGGAVPQAPKREATPPPAPPSRPDDDDSPVAPMNRPTPPSVKPDADDFNFRTNEVVMDSAVQKHRVPESGKARLMAQRKRDKEIEEAMSKHGATSPNASAYEQAMSRRKNPAGKRGRKPKDYIVPLDEEQIAEAIVLNEVKPTDKNAIEGLD